MSNGENDQNGRLSDVWDKDAEKSESAADSLHLLERGKANGKGHLDFNKSAVVNRYEANRNDESGNIKYNGI